MPDLPHKIVNVDDREINRYIRRQVLGSAGYTVIEADSGATALDLCATEKPDLVLLDVNMPGMGGLEACPRIKALHPNEAPIMVVHISATATGDDDCVRGLEGGADAYLTEPVAPGVLLATVKSMLRLRASEKALREREAGLRRLMDSNAVGILLADTIGIRDANAEYLRIVGATVADLRDKHLEWSGMTAPEYSDRMRRAFEQLRETGICSPFEKEYVRPDGTRVPVLMGGAALSMEPLELISFVVDMSAQKEIETALRSRTDELARSNDDLQRFAYFLSHDLQSPLRTVCAMSELLGRRYAPAFDAQGMEILKDIQAGVLRMSRLITDLLDYSRVSELTPREPQPLDARGMACWAVANLQAQIAEAGASVTVGDGEWWVLADDQLARVFQNLIGNALKYRSERPPTLEVRADRSGDEWIFAVRDNGIGFDMKFASRIFGVFQRLHPPDQYGGTGIGLAICKKLVERYGGRIWAESVQDRGSTFYFTVPGADNQPG